MVVNVAAHISVLHIRDIAQHIFFTIRAIEGVACHFQSVEAHC